MNANDNSKQNGNNSRQVHRKDVIDWGAVVKCVPKDEEAIPDGVYDKITELIVAKIGSGNKCFRVLDIGGGEGSFAHGFFNKIKFNKYIDENELDLKWIVYEHDKKLKDAYKEKFNFNCQKISLTIIEKPIPNESDEKLVDWLHNLEKEYPEGFDLVIASHVTYYFQDGALKLVTEIIDKLMSTNGIAWFVVRDRNCSFYQARTKYLSNYNFRDLHPHQFSSYFITYSWSLFDDVLCWSCVASLIMLRI